MGLTLGLGGFHVLLGKPLALKKRRRSSEKPTHPKKVAPASPQLEEACVRQ